MPRDLVGGGEEGDEAGRRFPAGTPGQRQDLAQGTYARTQSIDFMAGGWE
ncbi:MAG: hypothetical protein ACK50P_22635 [Planctomycetaceae bacterium]